MVFPPTAAIVLVRADLVQELPTPERRMLLACLSQIEFK
jgi:hypothetical protein